MSNVTPTGQVHLLADALRQRGIEVKLEHWDGHKHVDIAILDASIYIEIDGLHHFTNPVQIKADFKRTHFSDSAHFDTVHIPNELIDEHVERIADAIAHVAKERLHLR